MKQLQNQFTSGMAGFAQEVLTYDQVIRNEKFAVYKRSRGGVVKDWETIIINVIPAGTVQKFPGGIEKRIDEDTEMYPATGTWGKKGWSFGNETAALNKFEELKKQAANPQEVVASKGPYVPTGKPRGRAKIARPSLNLPKNTFTMIDLLAENTGYSQPNAYVALQALITDGKVKLVGQAEKTGKGKRANLYKIA